MEATVKARTIHLSRREMQILNYIAEGQANKRIAGILGISEQTVKSHVTSILRKMHAKHRAHAVAIAIRSGQIPEESKETLRIG